jgi:antitoxin CptB
MEEQDADIIGWAMRTIAVPAQWQGPLMAALQQLDFVQLPAGLGNAD